MFIINLTALSLSHVGLKLLEQLRDNVELAYIWHVSEGLFRLRQLIYLECGCYYSLVRSSRLHRKEKGH